MSTFLKDYHEFISGGTPPKGEILVFVERNLDDFLNTLPSVFSLRYTSLYGGNKETVSRRFSRWRTYASYDREYRKEFSPHQVEALLRSGGAIDEMFKLMIKQYGLKEALSRTKPLLTKKSISSKGVKKKPTPRKIKLPMEVLRLEGSFDSDPLYALGLKPNATRSEVKKAIKALQHKYHPDKNNTSLPKEILTSISSKINTAYKVYKSY